MHPAGELRGVGAVSQILTLGRVTVEVVELCSAPEWSPDAVVEDELASVVEAKRDSVVG